MTYSTIVLASLIISSHLVASAYAAQAFADQQPLRSDGRCGPYYGQADCNASFGDPNRPMLCCSKFGFCGSTNDHCNWSGRFAQAPQEDFVPCTQRNSPNTCNAETECCDPLNGVCSFIGTDVNATAPDGTCANNNVNQNQGAPMATPVGSATTTSQADNSSADSAAVDSAAPTAPAAVVGNTSAPSSTGASLGDGASSPTAPKAPDSNNLDGAVNTQSNSAGLMSSYTTSAMLLSLLLIATILPAIY